jgi:hypothetical protein
MPASTSPEWICPQVSVFPGVAQTIAFWRLKSPTIAGAEGSFGSAADEG